MKYINMSIIYLFYKVFIILEIKLALIGFGDYTDLLWWNNRDN